MKIIELLEEVGISGFLDILFMSLLIYSLLVWFKRTRAAFVLIGMSMIGAAYLIARQFDLELTTSVFQGFFAVIIIALVIIFQEEIKHFFEQVASRSLIRNLRRKRLLRVPRTEIEILVRTLSDFAREHIGALMVIRGKDPIARHLDGGVDLNGDISEPLLKSLFDPHSIGHDGAVVIEAEKITQFSCHLPLSKDLRKVGRGGTRHAAALGMAELSDALCLVVSEERGTISVARRGDIQLVYDPEELRTLLENFYQEIIPPQEVRPWKDFFKKNYREKVIAVTVTAILWFFLVHESKIDYRTFHVPVGYTNLPPHLIVTQVQPPEVEVTFSGSRRSFYFVSREDIHLFLKVFDAESGMIRRTVSMSDFSFPEGLLVEKIQPGEVALHVESNPE